MKKYLSVPGGMFAAFIILSQIYFGLIEGHLHIPLLILSLLLGAAVIIWLHTDGQKQEAVIEEALAGINQFMRGDTSIRIESEKEGSLYKLFHAVNSLATTLNAHALREQSAKEFMRNTLSDISHQLKTPLAALSIYHSILQEECKDQETVLRFALKSEKEVDRIEDLVQNLLKITRLDAGSITMEQHPENIAEIMYDVLSRFETRAGQEHKEILLAGAPELMLICDRGWIAEAISNLVKNALDHTSSGGSIRIEWKRMPALTQISVKDDGSGIHPEDIHHIFKRFYRSRFSQDKQGTGLGLPLVKAITEAHNGTVMADSIPGQGSIFILEFANPTNITNLTNTNLTKL